MTYVYIYTAGLLLSLFGGVPIVETNKDTTTLVRRGDIHAIMIGDPGIGKSRLLRALAQMSERG